MASDNVKCNNYVFMNNIWHKNAPLTYFYVFTADDYDDDHYDDHHNDDHYDDHVL